MECISLGYDIEQGFMFEEHCYCSDFSFRETGKNRVKYAVS